MKHYLGVDLGGTNIVAGVVNEEYEILAKSDTPTKAERDVKEVVADIVKVAKEALEKAGLEDKDVSFLGIGVPSGVNYNNNHVIYAPNLGWKDYDIISDIHELWDMPVRILNDADAAALGEAVAGKGKDYDSIFCMTLGTGVGGGFIYKKELYTGGDGYGLEPGHITIMMDGEKCGCGKKGCLEAYASVTALNRQARSAMKENKDTIMWEMCDGDENNINGKIVFDAAKEGDKVATEVVDKYIEYVAIGVGNFIVSFRPQAVIIGGGVSGAGERLFEPLKQVLPKYIYAPDVLGLPPIFKAELGNDAGIIGAAFAGGC